MQQTEKNIKENYLQNQPFAKFLVDGEDQMTNSIQITRNIIKFMNNQQRLKKAKAHILDALQNLSPRPFSQNLQIDKSFKIIYPIVSSSWWKTFLSILSFIFMYLVVLDNENYSIKIGLQSSILFVFWIDTFFIFYTQSYDNFIKKQKYSPQMVWRVILLILMTADLFIFIGMPNYNQRPFRPFRILRAFIPLAFNTQIRKTFIALVSSYKDITVYFIFFAIIICGWALVGSRALQIKQDFKDSRPDFKSPDSYKSNYSDLGSMIFIMYVTATYDSYPDNQLLAIQNSEGNYFFFIIFIFLNMFLFSSIPGSIIYIQTKSKLILLDQLQQQQSLMLAFVSLAGNDHNLSIDKLIKFLLYLYRYKIRYVEYITDITLKLDDNNNGSIQVNQFMQISKIILSNSVYYPPKFNDIRWWVQFRRFANQKLFLKAIVKHWIFQLVISIIIVLSFINAIFYVFNPTSLVAIFDGIFVILFAIQLIIRIIAIGPQNFFLDRWNNVDTFLVIFGLVFWILPLDTNADGVVRMSRIFRLASLFRLVSHSNFMKNYHFQMMGKLIQLFTIILQILPIIVSFIPLFLFFFYIFGIFGMQVYYDFYTSEGIDSYNIYRQFSHFQRFLNTQYIMVQVLTEAGWSMIAFDHGWKAPQYYGYTMLYFCIMHIIITYVIATLIKGIFWQVYFTVKQILTQRELQTIQQLTKQQENAKKTQQIQYIGNLFENNQFIKPDTILRRQIYQNKIDKQIFKRIYHQKKAIKKQKNRQSLSSKRLSKKLIVDSMIHYNLLDIHSMDVSQQLKSKFDKDFSEISWKSGRSKMNLQQIQQIDSQDFQSQLQDLFLKALLDPKTKFSHVTVSHKPFNNFLKNKIMPIKNMIKQQGFNLHQTPLYNRESINAHIFQVRTVLSIETSKRDQKIKIIKGLLEQQIIPQQKAEALLKRRLQQKSFNIDTKGTLRNLFLSNINEELVKKFQVEYFSNVFGQKYKQINRMNLEPLLRFEATLTYALKNIIRYPQIPNTQFFQMLTHIEDKISNNLLSRGSLFKFIYKLDYDQIGDIWFSIEYKQSQEMKVHFFKTGIWLNTKDYSDNKVYYSRDIFKYEPQQNTNEKDKKQFISYLKRFYQNFQSLAFSLLNQQKFFEFNPHFNIYDLFIQTFDVQQTKRFKNRELQISKIMLVILSKEQQRKDLKLPNLSYSLSDLKIQNKYKKKTLQFSFDDSQKQIFEKLKNVTALDAQKIIETQGLPFTYIVNLMKQIQDMITNYGQNYVFHIQKVLNDQYNINVQNFKSDLLQDQNQLKPNMNSDKKKY